MKLFVATAFSPLWKLVMTEIVIRMTAVLLAKLMLDMHVQALLLFAPLFVETE